MKSRKVKIKKYKSFEHKLKYLVQKNKITPIKIYPKEKCHFVSPEGKPCKRLAVGKGQLCEAHGGEKRIRNFVNDTTYRLIKQIKGKGEIYNPKFHPKEFLRLSAEGLSEVEIAAEFQVSPYRMQKWSENYELFSEAYDIGKAMYESWWLRIGKNGLEDSRNFNTALYKFLTGNKLGYSEKTESRNFNVNAGVLVVPKTPDSLEEWEKAKVVNVESEDIYDL